MSRPRRFRPSPVPSAIRSAVLPGWGQWSQGRRRAALGMFRVLVVLGALGLGAMALGPAGLAGLVVRPSVLILLLLGNVLLLAFRLFSTWDAFRGGGGRALTAAMAGLLLVVAVPHAAVGYYQFQAYRLITTVFGSGEPPTAASPPEGGPGAPGVPAATIATTTTSTVPWAGRERINLLILGGDAGAGRLGLRTDTMIVASLGVEDGAVALFGFPRNLSGLRFPDGTPFTDYQGILNEVYAHGVDHPDRFPGAHPGAAAITGMIEGISGLDIDHFVLIDLQSFVEVVDALGGVSIHVPRAILDPAYPLEDGSFVVFEIPAGQQEMDGTTALAYVRSRNDSSDYDRMGRQRCFLTAVAEQADVATLLMALPSLVPIIEESMLTDIPVEALPDLIELAGRVRADEALTVGLGPPDWNDGFENQFPVPDVEKIRRGIRLAVDDPAEARLRFGLTQAAETCGPEEVSTTAAG